MEERELVLIMASLIAAVRTARFDDREFQGENTPRMRAQVANSLALAKLLVRTERTRG